MERRRLAPIALVLLAGCGADKGSAQRPAAGAATSSATPTATATPQAAAKRTKVAIEGFDYAPRALEVAAGTKVTWVNRDESNHTVTFAKGPGDLGNVDPGKRLATTFGKPGRYAYLCQYHPNMTATITVK